MSARGRNRLSRTEPHPVGQKAGETCHPTGQCLCAAVQVMQGVSPSAHQGKCDSRGGDAAVDRRPVRGASLLVILVASEASARDVASSVRLGLLRFARNGTGQG